MRFKINIELTEGNSFPINWRSKILCVLKTGLKKCDNEIFEEFFGSAKQKNYTWSAYFQNVKFEKDKVKFLGEEKKIIVNLSAYDNVDSLNIYNAFSGIRFKEIKISEETKVVVTNISILPRQIIKDNILIVKTMSPIVCRDHNKDTGEDIYYTGEDNEFIEIIKRNLYSELKEGYGDYIQKDIENLTINSEKLKKIVVKFYNKTINASIGIVSFTGKSYLLDYIYNRGMGSLTGSGYGLLEMI